jgi:hypothetical protein
MKQTLILLSFFTLFLSAAIAQEQPDRDIQVGLVFQKAAYLYWENGLGVKYTCSNLFDKKLQLKAQAISSVLGSALGSTALNQHSFSGGAEWLFGKSGKLQIPVGFNAGYFWVDYEHPAFDVLPSGSMLFSIETGLNYRFDFPLTASATMGYNLINGNGVDVPGSIFPVFFKLGLFYRL